MPAKANKGSNDAMSQFELGNILARLDTNLSNLNQSVAEVISDFKEVHKDHEDRLRKLEKFSATKDENKGVHHRVDKLQTTIWRVIVFLAAGGTLTGGGYALFQSIVGGA